MFMLRLENQRPGSKTLCDFSFIVVLKGIMAFLRQSFLLNKNGNFNRVETGSRMKYAKQKEGIFVKFILSKNKILNNVSMYQFVVFKPLSYYFKETIGFDVKSSFARPPVSCLIKPGDMTQEC